MILAKGQLVLHFKGVLIAIEIISFISELTLGVKIRKGYILMGKQQLYLIQSYVTQVIIGLYQKDFDFNLLRLTLREKTEKFSRLIEAISILLALLPP